MEKSGQNDFPQMASDYIDAVIRKMRYRKKIRAEVRQELTDHFTDALADCKSDDERQTLAQELIAGFGDAKLLGVLLRRGKKRCRPLWRTMLVRAFQAIGILFLLLILYIGWFFSGKPIITTNYLEVMNTQVRPVAEDSQNAWLYYKQAIENYVDPNIKDFNFSPRNPESLSEEQRQIILDAITKNQKSFEFIRQGNLKPYYWTAYGTGNDKNNEILALIVPHLKEYKSLSRLMCWQVLLDAEKGDVAAALDNALEIYSFGHHLRGQNTTLIEQLVAMSIEGMSAGIMRTLLSEHMQSIDISLLSSFQRRFEELVSKENFIVSFESEKLMFYDELQRSFIQSQIGRGHLYLQRVKKIGLIGNMHQERAKLISLLYLLFTHPDREQTRQAVDAFYAEMDRLAAQTPASLHKQGIDIDKRCDQIAKGNLLLAILVPALGKVTQIGYRCKADSFATLTILSLVQYHKLHGDYPVTLEALVKAGLLDEVPIDPFSDKPLVYKKTDEGFILYSVGMDFNDDGGAPSTDNNGKPRQFGENGDWIFWPVNTEE